MKKYGLVLRISTLVMLPPILISSCSSVKNEMSNFENEVEKFNTSKKATNPQQKSIDAAKSINDAETNDDKIEVLKSLCDFPLVSDGFELKIKLAEIDFANRTLVNTNIIIQEINAPQNVASITFVITDFAETPKSAIEIAAEVFKIPIKTKTKHTFAYKAQNFINNNKTDEDKLSHLKIFATLPEFDENVWQIKVRFAQVDEMNKTELNVMINIFEKSNIENNLDVVQKITDFKVSPTLEEEAQKFTIEVNSTEATNPTSYLAAKSINEANTQNEKINKLRAISKYIPKPTCGYFINIYERVTFKDTKIYVPIKVVDATKLTVSKKVILTVSNLSQPLPIQVEISKFEVPTPNILETNISAIEAKNMIDAAIDLEAKLIVLNQLVNVPILSPGTFISKIELTEAKETTLELTLIIQDENWSGRCIFKITNFLP